MTAVDEVMGWRPAPGSVARHGWPLPARGAWWPAHRPALVAVAGLAGLAGVKAGPTVLSVLVLGVTVGLVVWWRSHPGTFHPWAGRVLLGLRRSGWAYGVRWRTAMMLSGLGGRFDGDEYLPRVVRVRAGRYMDRVTVRIVIGQQPAGARTPSSRGNRSGQGLGAVVPDPQSRPRHP